MKYELVEIEDLSDGRCHIYSVLPEGEEETLLEAFFFRYKDDFEIDVEDLLDRLHYIGHARGADERFFKLWEGRPGDGVCALFDIPEAHLRLYCIRFGSGILVVGSGGEKPKTVRTWEEDEFLTLAVRQMMRISEAMTDAIRNRELIIDNHNGLTGQFMLETKDGND